MELYYNKILLENKHITNRSVSIWLDILAGVVGVLWLLGLTGVVGPFTRAFYVCVPVSIGLLLVPEAYIHLRNLSVFSPDKRKYVTYHTRIILGCTLTAVFLMSCALSSYVSAAWLFPMMIACQYYSKRLTTYTFFAGFCGIFVAYFISIYTGIHDANLIYFSGTSVGTVGYYVINLVPRVSMYCLFYPLFSAVTKRTELLMKKQKLAMMTLQARQSFDHMHPLSETFETDCRIKMRYLIKNGIDVDTALANMDGNVDKYNEFALTFIGESNRKEDELYSLMDSDTLLQYGAKVHALRVKANALGITNLTDTAFFHEMEAYAGNLDIVEANWAKLSFEWDEACGTLSTYMRSLGINGQASDKYGHHITYKKWGEQLQEAFDALEVFDTVRARVILNELIQYQIDSDIIKKLESIIVNIDDILEA